MIEISEIWNWSIGPWLVDKWRYLTPSGIEAIPSETFWIIGVLALIFTEVLYLWYYPKYEEKYKTHHWLPIKIECLVYGSVLGFVVFVTIPALIFGVLWIFCALAFMVLNYTWVLALVGLFFLVNYLFYRKSIKK